MYTCIYSFVQMVNSITGSTNNIERKPHELSKRRFGYAQRTGRAEQNNALRLRSGLG
jgi:hypothetical protein